MSHVSRREIVLIRADDWMAEVAEEIVVVIQIRRTARPHIRHCQIAARATQIPHRILEFPVSRGARAGKTQDASCGIGRHDVLVRTAPGEKRHLQQQAATKPLVPFDVADVSFWRAEGTIDPVGQGDRRGE
jgi:hypothetical protein